MPLPKDKVFKYSDNKDTAKCENVTSDFGRRVARKEISRWHMGVDINPGKDNTDNGDAIYPLEEGKVIMLFVSEGYKVVVIRGTHRFGFGHIFFNGIPNKTTGMRSGDFILKQMNRSDEYAIIYNPAGEKPIAFGAETGTVSHPDINRGHPIPVSDVISNINIPIAPVGSSGGVPTHIHLYNFLTDPGYDEFYTKSNLTAAADVFRNPKDPLEFLTYTPFKYDVEVIDHNLSYPGHTKSSVQVRCNMIGAKGGGVYYNGIMDIDQMDLFIKKSHEHDSDYTFIKGVLLNSKICEGSRLNSKRYPSKGIPKNNRFIEIAGQDDIHTGSFTSTGINPSAYSHNAWDDYFFSDFPTLIHKNDSISDLNSSFAEINEDARYPDGEYFLLAKATTVRGIEYTSPKETPYSIIIDNFYPYIKKVVLKRKHVIFSEPASLYTGTWVWTGVNLSFNCDDPGHINIEGNEEIWVEVTSSEPMKTLLGSISSPNIKKPVFFYLHPNDDKTMFLGKIKGIALSGLGEGVYSLNFSGLDLADNPLMSFSPQDTVINSKSIPKHQKGGLWNPTFKQGVDSRHFIFVNKQI